MNYTSWWRLRQTEEMNRRFTKLAIICSVLAAALLFWVVNLSPNPPEVAVRELATWSEKLTILFGLLYFAIRRIGNGLAKLVCSVLLLMLCGTVFAMLLTPASRQRRARFLYREGTATMKKDDDRFTTQISDLNVEEVFAMLDGKKQPTVAAFEHSRQQAQLAALKVAQYEVAFEWRMQEFEQDVASVDAATGRSVEAGFKAALPTVKRRLQLERQYFDEISSLSSFLISRMNHFTVGTNGSFIFESDQEYQTFKVSLERIAQCKKTLGELGQPTSSKRTE